MQKVTSKLISGTKYRIESTSGGHTMVADQPTTVGGTDKGPNPKAYVAHAISSCAAQTVMSVATQRQWDIQEMNIEVTLDEVNDPANPGTKINQIEVKIEVKGNLTPAEIAAIERTAGKCPVLKLMEGPKKVVKSVVKV